METGITVRAQSNVIIVSVDGRVDGEMMRAVCRGILALDVPVVLDVSAIQITDPHVAIAVRDAAEGPEVPPLALVAGRLAARRILRRWTAGVVGIHGTLTEALADLGVSSDGPESRGGAASGGAG